MTLYHCIGHQNYSVGLELVFGFVYNVSSNYLGEGYAVINMDSDELEKQATEKAYSVMFGYKDDLAINVKMTTIPFSELPKDLASFGENPEEN